MISSTFPAGAVATAGFVRFRGVVFLLATRPGVFRGAEAEALDFRDRFVVDFAMVVDYRSLWMIENGSASRLPYAEPKYVALSEGSCAMYVISY
jgi:hypothetical protein